MPLILSTTALLAALAMGPLWAFENEQILSLAREGRLDSAYRLSLLRHSEEPKNSFYTFILGKLSHSGKESQEYLDKTIRLSPEDQELEEALYQTAQYYHAKGAYKKAILYYRKTDAQFPKGSWRPPSLYWMGHACLNYAQADPQYADTGKFYFEKLLKSVPEDHYYYPMGLEGLARWGLETKNYPYAKKYAIRALEKSFSDQKALLFYYLIFVSKETGDSISEKKFVDMLAAEYPGSMEYQHFQQSRQPSAGQYYLQMGAFSSKANAETLIRKLKSKDIEALISEKIHPKKSLFTVHSQLFSSREEARKFGEEKLKSQGIAYYLLEKN